MADCPPVTLKRVVVFAVSGPKGALGLFQQAGDEWEHMLRLDQIGVAEGARTLVVDPGVPGMGLMLMRAFGQEDQSCQAQVLRASPSLLHILFEDAKA